MADSKENTSTYIVVEFNPNGILRQTFRFETPSEVISHLWGRDISTRVILKIVNGVARRVPVELPLVADLKKLSDRLEIFHGED